MYVDLTLYMCVGVCGPLDDVLVDFKHCLRYSTLVKETEDNDANEVPDMPEAKYCLLCHSPSLRSGVQQNVICMKQHQRNNCGNQESWLLMRNDGQG